MKVSSGVSQQGAALGWEPSSSWGRDAVAPGRLCWQQTATWSSSAAFFYGLQVKVGVKNTIAASRDGSYAGLG